MSELYESELFVGMSITYNRILDRLGSIYEGPNKCSTFNDYAQPQNSQASPKSKGVGG